MAPRKPKLVKTTEAAEFDFDAFVQGFQRPVFVRSLYQRADLLPRLSELDDLTNELQAVLDKAEAAQGDNPERGITEVDVVTTTRTRLNALVAEFNETYQEYEASAVQFTFRVPDQEGDWPEIRSRMKALGVDAASVPSADDTDATVAYLDAQAMAGMSLTCTSHPMTLDQWQTFRTVVGDGAISGLVTAWNEAIKAVRPSAPFSRKRSATPDSEPSSVA